MSAQRSVAKPPAHLGPAAQAAWSELMAVYAEPGYQGRPIKPALVEAAAVQMARMRDAQDRIDREGLIIADAKGNPIRHPALGIERSAQEALHRLL